MTTNALICSIFTVFITSITKNLKASLCISLGGLFYALGYGMIFFINTYFMFIISAAIWTIGEILASTNTSIYIANHTPITHRGRFNSLFPIIRKLGSLIGPMIEGFYIKHLGLKHLWLFISALSLLAAIMMFKLYKLDISKTLSSEIESA